MIWEVVCEQNMIWEGLGLGGIYQTWSGRIYLIRVSNVIIGF